MKRVRSRTRVSETFNDLLSRSASFCFSFCINISVETGQLFNQRHDDVPSDLDLLVLASSLEYRCNLFRTQFEEQLDKVAIDESS